MPPKRNMDGPQSGADKKRQRMKDQRSIPVQGYQQRQGGSTASGNNTLPATIEVEKFAQARAFEITAMQRAMKSAKEAGTQRAFQSLPRHLRRRAASHNIRRLPLRLRERAKAEVPKDAAKPKKVSRKMLGRHRRVRPGLKAEMFKKRQREKLWLGTHVWHAKRMHMIDIWGFRLAEKPTEKAYRSSYRAAFHGAMVHDASYHQYFQLDGPHEQLWTLLDKVCDPATISPTSQRFIWGARECTTNLYDPSLQYPNGLIGPATFIWRPRTTPLRRATTSDGKSFFTDTILIRVHPTIARTAFSACERAIDPESDVKITKHEEEFATFEVTGKRAAEVVKAVLRPTKPRNQEAKAAWRKLDPEAGPGGVPEGMIFGFEVYDPRLSFPPKLDKSDSSPLSQEPLVPSHEIANVDSFWDAAKRQRMSTLKYKKTDLDARRSQNLLPGTSLRPLAQDDRIPILLSQRTLSPSTLGVSSSSLSSESTSLFTLTIPFGWSMAFWSSLVHSSPRVAGLRERALSTYEAGLATFPQDYPSTMAYEEHEKRREVDERGYWERRPPAKRPNFSKLGTEDPWNVDLEKLLRRKGKERGKEEEAMEEDVTENQVQPYLVPSKIATSLSASVSKNRLPTSQTSETESTPLARLEQGLTKGWTSLKNGESLKGNSLLAKALVRVRVDPCLRGVSEDFGLIYELEEGEVEKVRAKIELKRRNERVLATGEGEGAEDLCERPKKEAVIGRITTGTFSLARGKGYGIGVVSFSRYLEMVHRDSSARSNRNLVLFRNRDGETYRAATLSILP
ncbi:ribonuclease P/MRP protein subunit POP1 [Sporobolomyces salmoneus]|uniref:ribonuclease P/MRP protein subunit POP1 n=1 Tax=Sporobolomyces salmoneus TaxID=183962 RepID=UPI0031820A1B